MHDEARVDAVDQRVVEPVRGVGDEGVEVRRADAAVGECEGVDLHLVRGLLAGRAVGRADGEHLPREIDQYEPTLRNQHRKSLRAGPVRARLSRNHNADQH
ncbi:MAG TPA: hypothetical protein VFU36_07635 [Jatrophihabitans sp.]|nr:hypothetical protein [Jatrophihabitans sp.]